jgi:uncharacterized protein (DUF924 family)
MTRTMIFCAMVATGCGASAPEQTSPASLRQPTPEEPAHAERLATPAQALAVVDFWREAGPGMWFAKDPAFDRRFRERFAAEYAAAARGELELWLSTPNGALGLLILLDQYPRNSFRGTPRMYATDSLARKVADEAIRRGHDRKVEPAMQLFVYLPFGHSEDLRDQERSVELNERLGEPSLTHAKGHHDIIERFGRFPHRNAILGRTPRPEETKFLAEGGFAG